MTKGTSKRSALRSGKIRSPPPNSRKTPRDGHGGAIDASSTVDASHCGGKNASNKSAATNIVIHELDLPSVNNDSSNVDGAAPPAPSKSSDSDNINKTDEMDIDDDRGGGVQYEEVGDKGASESGAPSGAKSGGTSNSSSWTTPAAPTVVQLPTGPVVDLQLATENTGKIARQDPCGNLSLSGAKYLPSTPAASTAVQLPVPKNAPGKDEAIASKSTPIAKSADNSKSFPIAPITPNAEDNHGLTNTKDCYEYIKEHTEPTNITFHPSMMIDLTPSYINERGDLAFWIPDANHNPYGRTVAEDILLTVACLPYGHNQEHARRMGDDMMAAMFWHDKVGSFQLL